MKVGDTVTVNPSLTLYRNQVVEEMMRYAGRTATVTYCSPYDPEVRLDVDRGQWWWHRDDIIVINTSPFIEWEKTYANQRT